MSGDDAFVFTLDLDLSLVIAQPRDPQVDIVAGLVINLPLGQAPDYTMARLFAYRGEPVQPAGTVIDGLPVLHKVPQFFIARTPSPRAVGTRAFGATTARTWATSTGSGRDRIEVSLDLSPHAAGETEEAAGAPSSDMWHVQCGAPRQANAGPLYLITRACSGSHETQAAPSADWLCTSDVTATSATTATRSLGGSTSTLGRLALVFRLRTGVSLAGIPVYFLIGIVAIVSTVPSLVLGGRWIPSTVPGWDWLAAIARTSAEVGASPTFATALAMMAKVGLALFPLVPVAALLRALRAKSQSHSARRWAPRG